jgi:hypothetical protein
MPPELWGKSAIDVAQRHGYYKSAADRIEKYAARFRELDRIINAYLAGALGPVDAMKQVIKLKAAKEM